MSETAKNLVDNNNKRNCSPVIKTYRKYSLVTLLFYGTWATRIIFFGKPPLHDRATFRIVKYTYGNESAYFILFRQVAAAAVFTPMGEVERSRARAAKGVKDFVKEEWVDRVS